MTPRRDEGAVRRSRAQSAAAVVEQWSGGDPAGMAVEVAHYVEHGWKPDGPKTLHHRGETPRMPTNR